MAPLIVWDPQPPLSRLEARNISEEHARMGDLDPLRNALFSRKEEILTLDEVIAREDLESSSFYKKVFRPYQIEHAVGMYISEPGGWECNLGLLNGPARGDFGPEEKQLLADVRPSMEIALALFAHVQCKEAERRVLAETLDKLTIGTFILDDAGRVVGSNSIAKKLLQSETRIQLIDRRLRVSHDVQNAKLQSMISKAVKSASRDREPFVEALMIDRDSIGTLGILVRSIDVAGLYGVGRRSAVVYVTGFQDEGPRTSIVSQVFGLTHAEAQLATLLARGHSLTDAALKCGLSEHTVRSYAKTIFRKTGVSRQAELVRLILRSAAVLG
jgi:DNA-binding CsgD family transcriptional regulator/PAS domain-containing protein